MTNPQAVSPGAPAADRLAIVLSGLCLVHCLVLPLLLALLPWLAWFEAHAPWLHKGLLVLIVPVSGWALYRGFGEHGLRWVVVGGAISIVGLISAVLLEPIAPTMEVPLTLLFSLLLMACHLGNMRALSRCAVATMAPEFRSETN